MDVRRYFWVRLAFGLLWALDAALKWLPGFRQQFPSMIDGSSQGQPPWLEPWFRFWAHLVGHSPATFAVLTALAETAIALGLIFGILQRATFTFGATFALLIWGVGEGFGGPYGSGATDIGSAIIYALVFVFLAVAVPRTTRAAAPGADVTLVQRWPFLTPLTFLEAPQHTGSAAPTPHPPERPRHGSPGRLKAERAVGAPAARRPRGW